MTKLTWPLKKSWQFITHPFGVIWAGNDLKNKMHSGVDIRVTVGSPVFTCGTGKVVKTGSSSTTKEWGHYVVIEHESGSYCSVYHHINETVKEGDTLDAGAPIGVTAKIAQPHLHFGIWSGKFKSLATRGALPFGEFVGKAQPFLDDPAFPSNFLNPKDPNLFSYIFVEDGMRSMLSTLLALFFRDLKRGDTGPDVKALQVLLNADPETRISEIGPGSPGKETDSFGALTENAVKRFQVKHRIASQGVGGYGEVGPKTRAKLNNLSSI